MSESFDQSPQLTSPAEDAETERPSFPWPPRPGSGILTSFVDTWVESITRPSSFFAAMPHQGFGSALSYYLPIAIIASALLLFWRAVAVATGFAGIIELLQGQPYDPVAELTNFLLSPITATVYLVVAAAIVHVGAKMVGAGGANYMATLRVVAFASGPQIFVAIPVLGAFAMLIWTLVLTIIGVREVHQTTTGRATLAILLPAFLLVLLGMMLVLAGLLGMIAVEGL